MGLSEINYADECSKIGCGLRKFFGFHGRSAVDNALSEMWCLSATMGMGYRAQRAQIRMAELFSFYLQGCRTNHKAATTCATIAQVVLHPTKHDNSVGTVYQFI